MSILTWHNDPALKAKVIAGYDAHIKADTLIKGEYFNYGNGFKGCHIGCVVHDLGGNDTGQYSDLTGLPVWLRDLSEYFFENMAYPKNQQVSRAVLDATPVGKDITIIYHEFMIWLLLDENCGTIQYCDKAGTTVTKNVAALHQRVIDGDNPDQREWAAAWAAAGAAAGDAARDAAGDAARAAAWAAAWDAAWAAAGDAARAAAGDAAWDAAWDAQASKLVELLGSIK